MSDAVESLVAAHDRDVYLASLYAPAAVRPHLLALAAFSRELARIPRLVSEAAIGEIRLEWWLESLEALYRGEAVDHPVAQALGAAINTGNLPQAALAAMVEAERWNLYEDRFPSLTEVEVYFGQTASALIHLSSLLLGRANADLSGNAGVALGLSRRLLADPQRILPVTGETAADLAALATRRLAEARKAWEGADAALLPALLPVAITDLNLARFEAGGQGEVSPLRRQIRLWRAARRNRF
jgi:phytoene synthase